MKALLPEFRALIPAAIDLRRHRPHDYHPRLGRGRRAYARLVAILLVVLVVFVFLRSVAHDHHPSVAVPLSLLGTFGAMYFLGYSLDNLSLMALTISTGFVVDDAIVVSRTSTAIWSWPAAARGRAAWAPGRSDSRSSR